jgi:glycine/D-amino acid oxidase-like deaminating enzyme
MTSTLTDTVAIVTGASSGIGEATAAELARHGASVAVIARRVRTASTRSSPRLRPLAAPRWPSPPISPTAARPRRPCRPWSNGSVDSTS